MNNSNESVVFRLSRLSLAIALVSLAQGVFAQDTVLAPVTVEAQEEQGAVAASTVTDDTLDRLRPATSDAASLLRDVPGVTLNGAGGVSSLPAIRGLADDRLRVKLDGMDLIATCPNHMNPPLSYVDPSNIGTLKVFAGVTPVSVGGDSIGGTIVAETKAPEFALPGADDLSKGEFGASYGSNNDAFNTNLKATYANEVLSLSYSGAWAKAGNYTAGGDFKDDTHTGRLGHLLPLDEVGSTAYESWNHTLGIALKAGEDLFEVKFGHQNMPEQLYPNQRMDLLDNEQKRVSGRYLTNLDWGSLEVSAYHERVDHFMDFGPDKRFWYSSDSIIPGSIDGQPCSPISPTCAAGMPMYSESKTTGVAVKTDIDLSETDLLRVGAEYQRYRLDDYWTASGGGMWPGTFLNINDGERDRLALFTEWETQFDPQWLGLLGVRYERVTTDAGDVQGYNDVNGMSFQLRDSTAFNAEDRKKVDNNVDLSALARYTHDANLDIEFGLARKVRSPNLYERYTWSEWGMAAVMNNFVGDGNGYVGDIDLEPEKAHTVSATFDWHAADRSWELKATPYYTRVSDYIDAVKGDVDRDGLIDWNDDAFNVLFYKNQSARLYGIDVSGKMPLARNDWGSWGLKGLLNYTDGKNRDSGDDLYNIMPLNAKLTLTHDKAGWSNAVELVMVADKDDVSDVRNEIETNSYTLVNLRGSHSWKTVRVDFGVENLFDESYDLPTGGTYTGQGWTMSKDRLPWGTAVPGMGRSIYAGVNVTF
jgi:iron complex outermembrane receptor protein